MPSLESDTTGAAAKINEIFDTNKIYAERLDNYEKVTQPSPPHIGVPPLPGEELGQPDIVRAAVQLMYSTADIVAPGHIVSVPGIATLRFGKTFDGSMGTWASIDFKRGDSFRRAAAQKWFLYESALGRSIEKTASSEGHGRPESRLRSGAPTE